MSTLDKMIIASAMAAVAMMYVMIAVWMYCSEVL